MDELTRRYTNEVTQLWAVAEKLKTRKDAVVGEVREAYCRVIKDILWLISNSTYTFLHEMFVLEEKVFTEEDIQTEMARLMSRFPAQ
jgi:hypothetical protein